MTIKNPFPSEIQLSGADCFFLAMERHYEKYGNAGNVCHLMISLDGHLTAAQLISKISLYPVFDWLSKIELDRGGFFGLPKWKYNPDKKSSLEISEIKSTENDLPAEVVHMIMSLHSPCLFRFTLIHRSNGSTDIVFSWHHILMDAQGAETLMKLLGGEAEEKQISFFPSEENKIFFLKAWVKLHFSKEFIKKSSRKPLVQLIDKEPDYNPVSDYLVIHFSEEETQKLDKKARVNGATFGKGSFYLAATARSVYEWLQAKGKIKGTFWIPVPQNRRRRGALGPVISNLQSFLFYRIPVEKLTDLKTCTTYITAEMFDQIRKNRPDDYAVMSDVLRRIPSALYYRLVKGPAGGSIASFLFSDPGVNEFRSFMGFKVTDITNYPPGTFPPGLMVIFERFNNRQKMIINYAHQIVAKEDLRILEQHLRRELLS